MSMTSVLVVEDHPLLAEALGALLTTEKGFSVVGTASTIAEAMRGIASAQPRLIVLDQHLPDGLGTDLARVLRRDHSPSSIVMLTGDLRDETLLAAIEAGVAGFIPKRERIGHIVELLQRAALGEIVIPAEDLSRLLRHQREREQEKRERDHIAATLTPRDRQILDLMAQGLDTREMAEHTALAVNTIRGHVQNVIEKLETHSRLEAVLRAEALGLVHRPGENGHPQT